MGRSHANLGGVLRLAGLTLAFWCGLTALAAAHASLNSAAPADGAVVAAPPQRFSLTFSEPVSPLALRLVRPQGDVLALERFTVHGNAVAIEPPSDLSTGTHVLTWRVVSADGHPIGGSVIFSIGAPSAAPPPVADVMDPAVQGGLWATRVAVYVGLVFGIGGAFAVAWLVPASRSGAGVAAAALAAGLAGAVLAPGFQGLDALGATLPRYVDPQIWAAGMSTSYGLTVAAMLAALCLGAVSLLATSPAVSRPFSLASLLAGAAALSLSGHAGAAEPQWLTRPSVFLHAAAVASWAGALVPLALAVRRDTDDAEGALRRFSSSIPYAVLALVVAGGILAAIQVEQPSALLDTRYGRLLLAKLGLVALLLALAALNRWRLAGPASTGAAPARARLVRSIAFETLLVLVVLGIAAGWRFTPPPRSLAIAAARPAMLHIHTAQAMADVTVSPGRAGPVTVTAVLMTGDFGALDAKEVTFVFANTAAGIGASRHAAEKPGDGTWRAGDIVLPAAGIWTLQIEIRVNDLDLVRIGGELAIGP